MSEQSPRVLLLDDEESLRKHLSMYLHDTHGLTVDAVADGNAAMRLIEEMEGRYDVALLDEALPEGPSGLEVLRAIKAKYPDIEVILFTGWGRQAGMEALHAGAYRFFTKLVDKDELAATIRFAAEQKRLRRERDYMAALVKASQALTQTTRLDEQLNLVWNFVREQLATPTCFVALYDPQTDTLRFPLSYDEGQPEPLPDLTLGADQSNWGLAGFVVMTGQEQVWFTREQKEKAWQNLGIKSRLSSMGPSESGICLPLRVGDKILGTLSVQSYKPYAFDQALSNAVRALSNQVSVALENSRLMTEAIQKALNLEKLQNLTVAINSTLDLKEVVIQTCQAAVELSGVDHSGLLLFEPDLATGKVFAEYPTTERTLGQIIPVRGIPAEERLVFQQEVINIPDLANDTSLGVVRDVLLGLGIRSIVIVPVVFDGKVVASFSLDAMQKPRAFSQSDIEICQSLANQVAVAIRNARLYEETREGREYLRSLYQATAEIISPRDPNEVLQHIVDIACRTTGVWRAVALLVDESDRPRILAQSGFEFQMDAATNIRETGISREVLKSGESQFIPDVELESHKVHPAMLEQGVKGAACLPLPLAGKNIGVLWIHFREKHSFSKTEKQALQLYANQSAIAYDNSRRMRELEQLKNAAEAMASKAEWKAVLQEIAKSAKQVLEADYTLIWPYDAERKIFFPEDLVAENVPDDLLERFRKVEPETGKTTERVLEKGYVVVEDLSIERPDFLGDSTRGFLDALDVKSFQGIRLDVAGEPLGVLYVDYRHPRGFGDEDRRILEHFANHAALTLKKARLLEQVRRSHAAAMAVAQVSTLGDLDKTLNATVEGALAVLRCNIATVYSFDEENRRFVHAVGTGYQDKRNLCPPSDVNSNPDSAPWRIIRLQDNSYYLSEYALGDELLKGNFVKAEGVQSALGIQLCFGEHRVGVMFINYRTPHRFAEDEIQDALQFANQAAVAISNARLFEETERAREREKLIASISQKASANLELIELLDTLYKELAGVLRAPILPSTALWNVKERCLRLVASKVYDYKSQVIETERERECVQLGEGITGWVALHKEQLNVPNVGQEPRYKRFVPTTKSEMAVPILYGDEKELIGVLDIESPKENAFTEEDFLLLKTLANQLSVAIRNAQLYERTKRQSETLEGLYGAGKAITSTLAVDEVLTRIAEQALHIVGAKPQEGCFSHVALLEENKLRFIAGFPLKILTDLRQNVGEIDLQKDAKKGIAGQAVLTGQTRIAHEVPRDLDWIPLRENINIHSQLSVPLRISERIIGVLSIEHPEPAAFSEEDVHNIELLAAQAAVAIQNARRFGETEKALAARTALAWTGMVSSTWRHAIEKHAITIREQIELLRDDLAKLPKTDSIGKRLEMMQRLANQILEKPITAPLSAEEGAMSVPVNELIRERTNQLWKHDVYKPVKLDWDRALEESATVRASPEWLRRALDILIDNAVDATEGLTERKIAISTQRVDHRAEISIRDNGRGIPSDVRERLFREPIKKTHDEKGLGMGLLFAQTIVQTYGGEIRVKETGTTGTTMVVSLPLEA